MNCKSSFYHFLRYTTVFVISLGIVGSVYATPSTQIWIPSTDIQAFKSVHLNFDTYPRLWNESDALRYAPLFSFGPTVGILPWNKIQAEIGFDLMFQGNATLDKYPIYFHAKLATPEDSLITWSPAIAAGIYNLGIKSAERPDPQSGFVGTTQNIGYGLIARTLPYVGRLSVGYFYGNGNLIVDEKGEKANHGILASWDRTMKEISDKLWLAVDYQGGRSALSAVNFGFAWAFADNTSVIFAYDLFTNRDLAGSDTFSIQIDINI